MFEAIKWLLAGIFLLVGVLEMNVFLIGLGIVFLGILGVGVGITLNQKRKEKEKRLSYTNRLNQYLQANQQLNVNEHITIKADGSLDDYDEAYVYYDGEKVAMIKDFMGTEDVYAKLTHPIFDLDLMIGFVDNNNNGIDDRLEEQINGAYFVREIGKRAKYIEHPGILAGLKEICELLNKIDELEEKYPQITSRLRKLYQHYLPLLITILDQYATLEEKQASTGEISNMEIKLEKTVLLTSEAIKTIMSGFVNDDLINMKADMSVLETILKKDGLVKEGNLS